jgi:hypothetical protein
MKIQSITGRMRGIRTPATGNHIIKYKANSITIRAFRCSCPPRLIGPTMAVNGRTSHCFRNVPIHSAPRSPLFGTKWSSVSSCQDFWNFTAPSLCRTTKDHQRILSLDEIPKLCHLPKSQTSFLYFFTFTSLL